MLVENYFKTSDVIMQRILSINEILGLKSLVSTFELFPIDSSM